MLSGIRVIRTVALGLAIASPFAMLSSCAGGPPDIYGRKAVEREQTLAAEREAKIENEIFSTYRQIYTSKVVGNEVQRLRIGFVEHRSKLNDDEGRYVVYSMTDSDRAVGFYMPNGATFRIKDIARSRGSVHRIELGRHDPEAAIRLLLDVPTDVDLQVTGLPKSIP